MKGLLIDNYDSYTYNLLQLLAEVIGAEPKVVTNDAPECSALDVADFDYVVISPGPGHPANRRDVGFAAQMMRPDGPPVLGVCLGHQLIAEIASAEVVRAPRPRHGYSSLIRHTGDGLFSGIPQGFAAVRYHSLHVPEPLPAELRPLAWAEDGVVMGLRHRRHPWWGVQFHPESIATEYGRRLIANFAGMCDPRRIVGARRPHLNGNRETPAVRSADPRNDLLLRVRRIDRGINTEEAFRRLFGDSQHAAWLDSNAVIEGYSRFSFLGAPLGQLGEVLRYRVGDGYVTSAAGAVRETGTIYDVLASRLAGMRLQSPDLPFAFNGGYVGYLGYETKADCGAANRHRSAVPDAVWMLLDRLVVVDHVERRTYLVALCEDQRSAVAAADEWLALAEATLRDSDGFFPEPAIRDPVDREILWSEPQYTAAVDACLEKIRAGESYEICLTTRARQPLTTSPIEFYRRLRRQNPAPYAAYLKLGSMAVMSSSPERYLQITEEGQAECRPIKGTAPRSDDPVVDDRLYHALRSDPKSQAENLMIVDLTRNDLGRVCEVGSVSVPEYLKVERYATMHQLVSTVRGTLRPGVGAVRAAQACFPPGSMTGAPKLRTMEILDNLEPEARGVYSGALGYFALNGTADLSVVIRTAVATGAVLEVGAGGAVVADSDPAAEYQEMILKVDSTLKQPPDQVHVFRSEAAQRATR